MENYEDELLMETETMLMQAEANLKLLKGGEQPMVRNMLNKKNQPADEDEDAEAQEDSHNLLETPGVIEREINISLLNDKLNYLISAINKIAEASDIKL